MTRAQRAANDYYRTPPDLTRSFLGVWARTMRPAPKRILEPSAGDGAMLDPLREHWPEAQIDAYDIQPQHPDVKARIFYLDDVPGDYDLVFTNPPYVWAQGFAAYGLSVLRPGGSLVLLLRLAFLASVERRAWLQAHMPHHVYVLSSRPSFKGDGSTDFSEYAWFVWRKVAGDYATRITIL